MLVSISELEVLGELDSIVIKQPKEVLDNMNEWCVNQHGQSGMVSTTTLARYSCLSFKIESEKILLVQKFLLY